MNPLRGFLAALCGWLSLAGPAPADDADLAAEVRKVFENHCHRCHGKDGTADGGFDFVLDVRKMVERRKIVPADPVKSRLLRRVRSGEMPPEEEKVRPSKEEVGLLERWIRAGAPAFPPSPGFKRKVVTELDTYRAMDDHLESLDSEDWPYQRYFLLGHLHNHPRVSDAELRLYRAGVAKLLNSLSWRRKIVQPRSADKAGTVLAFDLRDLDWDLNQGWQRLIGATSLLAKENFHPGYPYALEHTRYPDAADLNRLARRVYERTATFVPAVRADWFLATASQPPLYHELLNLPASARELENQLKVDVRVNFLRSRLVRAGFEKSGVSVKANRLVERHESAYGAYWKSYDFRSAEGHGNLMRFPLGPLNLFPEGRHPFEAQAFEHDGGEIIFHLPNGLQGYLLIDGKDRRINEGPSEVVRDRNETAGKGTIIVNGLSCMGCHQHGVIHGAFSDGVRGGAGVRGPALSKVRRLYPAAGVLNDLFREDEELFLRGLEKAIGPFVRTGPDRARDIRLFPEPISLLASPFLKARLAAEDGARELGVTDPAELKGAIRASRKLRDELGLKPWLAGDTISREKWQSVEGLTSLFQQAAEELQRGTPYRLRR